MTAPQTDSLSEIFTETLIAQMEPVAEFVTKYPSILEVGIIIVCILFAFVVNRLVLKLLRGSEEDTFLRTFFTESGTLAFTFLILVFPNAYYDSGAVNLSLIGQSLIAIFILVRYVITRIQARGIALVILYTLIPIIILKTFNLLTPILDTLDSYSIDLGNLHISLYDVVRVSYFGFLLFWLGKESNKFGKQKIRQQAHLDLSTREIIAKLFEVGVYIVIFLILLNILGINLTTLTVLGGAIGVGIGFGLQSIASNFISGLIILLDRSLAIGDYIELEDGRAGLIRELNLRAVTLETFDGKDIVVPNDVFFSQTFTNWTHKNEKQRYAIDYDVAYSTDLDRLFPLIKDLLIAHPKVLSGADYLFEEQPDVEISGFADNGISLHIEFWMEAIDDGEHRVGGDLLYAIWQLMKREGFEFPFPQREVRILNDGVNGQVKRLDP